MSYSDNVGKTVTYMAMLESGIKQITDTITAVSDIDKYGNRYYTLENSDSAGYSSLSVYARGIVITGA